MKFTNKGFVKVSVSLDKEIPEDHKILMQFEIADSGIGIPEEKQDIIYERFAKVIPSNKGLYKGLGLGLAVVKQFVNELKGKIHLKSKVEKGPLSLFSYLTF